MKKILFVLAGMFLFSANAWAAISFTNGIFNFSFETCGNTDPLSDDLSCLGGNATMPWPSDDDTCSNATITTTSANYTGTGAGGGSGLGAYFCPSANGYSAYLRWGSFSGSPTKIWIRWYSKIPSGNAEQRKWMYMYNPSNNCGIKVKPSENKVGSFYGGANESYPTSLYDLSDIYGGYGYDNQWHAYEVLYDNDNNVLRIWIDGYLVHERSVPFPGGGFTQMDFHSNTSQGAGASSGQYVYVDDIAIATEGYAGFLKDASGNDMIGPDVNVRPSPPTGLRIVE